MDMLKVQDAIGQWAKAQFGDQVDRVFGIYNHLCKEQNELALNMLALNAFKEPSIIFREEGDGQLEEYLEGCKEEITDCIMLLLDLCNALGIDSEQAVLKKLEVNKKREWGEPDEHGTVEHIR